MERWAANTLRGLGIFATAILMIAASLFLLLMTLCTWGGPSSNHTQAMGFLIGALIVLAFGIFVIARLARGLAHSGLPETVPPQPTPGVPLHISPADDEALNHLSYAVGASIALGVLLWGVTLYRMWIGQSTGQPGYSYQRPFFIIALIAAGIHYLPYILLLFRLQHKPDRAALAFSIGMPAASLLHTATTLPLIWRVFSYRPNVTQTLLPMCAALILQVVILVFAWRANQRFGYKQEPVSLVIAGAAMYAYFIIFGSSNAWMYRFFH